MGRKKQPRSNDCRQCGAPLDVPQPGQTELRCKYCGVSVAVESPVPAPESPGKWAAHYRAVQRDNVRMVIAVLAFSALLGAIPAMCSAIPAVVRAWKSGQVDTPPPSPPSPPPPPPTPVDPQALDAWGRRVILSQLDRLHRCGLELLKEEPKPPRKFTLAVYFNDDGSVRDLVVDMPPKSMALIHADICMKQEMRGRPLTEERPPAQRAFNIKVPLEFDANGNAHESTGTAEPEAAAEPPVTVTTPVTTQKSTTAASAAPKLEPKAAPQITNEEWGRRRILARLGQLQKCGRELLRRERTNQEIRDHTAKGFEQSAPEPLPHQYLLTIPFNERGDTGQAKLSPHSPISDCVDGELRQFVNGPKEWSPQRRSFQIQMSITFDANGNANASP